MLAAQFYLGAITSPLAACFAVYVVFPILRWYMLAIGYDILMLKLISWKAFKKSPWDIYCLLAWGWPIQAIEYRSVNCVEVGGIRWTPYFKYEDFRKSSSES